MNEIAERVRKTVNESDHPGDFVSAARTACIEIDLLQSKLEGYATREANGMRQVAELEDQLAETQDRLKKALRALEAEVLANARPGSKVRGNAT